MNKTKEIAIFGMVVLFAVLTVSTASAHVFMKYKPLETSVPEGECHSAYVEVWVNVSGDDDLKWGAFAIRYDPSCVNVTDHEWGPWIDPGMTSWDAYPQCAGPGYNWIIYTFALPVGSSMVGDEAMLVNITVHCESSEYCETPLELGCGEEGCTPTCEIVFLKSNGEDCSGYTLVNGTFECGTPPLPETFTKSLVEGWNLISLPLEPLPGNESVSEVLKTVSYDMVYSYNASSQEFELLDSSDTMEPGVGYFVNVTSPSTWTYTGIPYEQMNVSLKPGLNLIGWINSTHGTSDILTAGDYWYATTFNATAQSYTDTFNPVAPDVFNRFTTMEPGMGFWVSAKHECWLNVSV